MQQAVVLDKIDLKILQVLQENGRLSNVELSERVALSPSPCLRRLKQLEDNGIIRRYAALLSPMSLGLGLQVMIRVTTDKSAQARGEFEGAVRTWTEVLSCFALTGESDYLLHRAAAGAFGIMAAQAFSGCLKGGQTVYNCAIALFGSLKSC